MHVYNLFVVWPDISRKQAKHVTRLQAKYPAYQSSPRCSLRGRQTGGGACRSHSQAIGSQADQKLLSHQHRRPCHRRKAAPGRGERAINQRRAGVAARGASRAVIYRRAVPLDSHRCAHAGVCSRRGRHTPHQSRRSRARYSTTARLASCA